MLDELNYISLGRLDRSGMTARHVRTHLLSCRALQSLEIPSVDLPPLSHVPGSLLAVSSNPRGTAIAG